PAMAKAMNIDQTGALVGDVTANSPASKAGLKQGDVILSLNGEKVNDANQLRLKIGMADPTAKVNLKIMRDGKTMDLPVQLGEFPSTEERASIGKGGGERNESLDGVTVEALTSDTAQELKLDSNAKGVVVVNVSQGSAAAEAGLRRGDVIQQVNRKNVASVNEFKQAMNTTTKDKPVLLLVNREGTTLFLAV